MTVTTIYHNNHYQAVTFTILFLQCHGNYANFHYSSRFSYLSEYFTSTHSDKSETEDILSWHLHMSKTTGSWGSNSLPAARTSPAGSVMISGCSNLQSIQGVRFTNKYVVLHNSMASQWEKGRSRTQWDNNSERICSYNYSFIIDT